MANDAEKVNPGEATQSGAEIVEAKTEAAERPKSPEVKPIDEAELARRVEQTSIEVQAEESRVLDTARKEMVAPPTLNLEQAKADAVLESGGWAARFQAIRDKIVTLTKTTQDKIGTLMGGGEKEMTASTPIVEVKGVKAEVAEHEPTIKDFSEILKNADTAVAELSPGTKLKVAGTMTEMAAITDTAREITNEGRGVETVDPKTENVDQASAHHLAEGESILEKENPFEYMAAVRVSNNLPVFEGGKLVLKTACDMSNGEVPRLTLHFTVNCRVGNNDGGNWDDVGYAYVIPMDKMVEVNGKPYAFGKEDTFFATARGVEIPASSKIMYRADKENDPTFQALMEQCRQNNISVEFIKSEASDNIAVERILEKDGYGNYAEGKYDDSVDSKLAEKMGVRMGGYAMHSGTPIWRLEKTFLSGQPGYKSEDAVQQQSMNVYTPFEQFTAVAESPDDIPRDVKDRYIALAASNLALLLDNPETFEHYASNNGKSKWGKGSESTFKRIFYDQAFALLLDKGEFTTDVLTKNPEVKNKIQEAAVTAADRPEVRAAFLKLARKSQPEDIPPELRMGMAEAYISRGNSAVFDLLEYAPNFLNAEQQQAAKESILAHLDTFADSVPPDLLGEFAADVASRSDYFSQNYGTAFVEKMKTYIKS